MTDDARPAEPAALHGEIVQATWEMKVVKPTEVKQGEVMLPAALLGDAANRFASSQLIAVDLDFALDCFLRAEQIGLPDEQDTLSKALIHAGVISYARPFVTGVRTSRLSADELAAAGCAFDLECHQILVSLRSKHIAHSVNEFEGCRPAALIVGPPGGPFRDGGQVGVIINRAIGLPMQMLVRAIAHIQGLTEYLAQLADRERVGLHEAFEASLEAGAVPEWVPVIRVFDRAAVGRRRVE